MSRHLHAIGRGALMALVRAGLAQAPTFETTKVEGTEHVDVVRTQTAESGGGVSHLHSE
jgi:hypothetical protein